MAAKFEILSLYRLEIVPILLQAYVDVEKTGDEEVDSTLDSKNFYRQSMYIVMGYILETEEYRNRYYYSEAHIKWWK